MPGQRTGWTLLRYSFSSYCCEQHRPRTTRRAPHIYPDIWGDGFQYHSSQLTFSDEWYCPQTWSPEDVGSTPGLSHSHRRVLTATVHSTQATLNQSKVLAEPHTGRKKPRHRPITSDYRLNQSINPIPTKPHTGKEKPHPSPYGLWISPRSIGVNHDGCRPNVTEHLSKRNSG